MSKLRLDKFCKDCKWAAMDFDPPLCDHPKLTRHDLVTGEETRNTCQNNRMFSNLCDVDGRHWEAKE